MAQTVDFTNFATELNRTVEEAGGGLTIINGVMDGVAALRDDFDVVTVRDRAALLSAEFLDAWKVASQSFDGRKAVNLTSKFAEFTEADIDLEFTLDDIKQFYNTYLGKLKAPDKTLNEVYNDPFELFFINEIIRNHFRFARLKTAWKGVYNPTPVGAQNIADGFIRRTTVGRTSNEIKASNILAAGAGAITSSNAYEQVNGVADLVKNSANPELLSMPMNCYLSQNTYDLYRKNRRTLFPEHVGPGEKPTTLDDYTNITFVVDPGLAGKETIVVTPKQNLKFIANEAPGAYRFKVVEQIKSFQLNVRMSIGFNYASPELTFLNDKV